MNEHFRNKEAAVTSKELTYAAIEGRTVIHFPAAAPYQMLTIADHWTELTGLPVWEYYRWIISEPDEHAKLYRLFDKKLPFDVWQLGYEPSRQYRNNTEVVFKDGIGYYLNKNDDTYSRLNENIHHSNAPLADERTVFDRRDAREKVIIEKAETAIENGCNEYIEKIISVLGYKRFIMSGGVINPLYCCSWYVGLNNLFLLLYDEPGLIGYLCERIQEQNIETIRRLAAAGGDAIYINDAYATSDMIPLKFYEKFCLPYTEQSVKEIRNQGKKAILMYFGGVADRVEQIVSTGADALIMEASMKNFVNDFETIAKQINGRICIFGNLDPYVDIELASDEILYYVVKRQVELGRKAGRFVASTGSPLTPNTHVSRIRKYIDLAHSEY